MMGPCLMDDGMCVFPMDNLGYPALLKKNALPEIRLSNPQVSAQNSLLFRQVNVPQKDRHH
jgi:hypothetical protein